MDLVSTIRICVQIALKNTFHTSKTVTYELLDQPYDPEVAVISSAIVLALNDGALSQVHISPISAWLKNMISIFS